MRCVAQFSTMWHNLKNVKNTYGGVLLLVKEPATLLKVTLLHGCFSRFLICTNGTKSRKAPHITWANLDSLAASPYNTKLYGKYSVILSAIFTLKFNST